MTEGQSDVTVLIISAYNLILFGIAVKWLLPELKKLLREER
jgi:hypothetical protein